MTLLTTTLAAALRRTEAYLSLLPSTAAAQIKAALEQYDLAVADEAIVQRVPTDAEHAVNVQLSAVINQIEKQGWVPLARDDLGWLKGALRP